MRAPVQRQADHAPVTPARPMRQPRHAARILGGMVAYDGLPASNDLPDRPFVERAGSSDAAAASKRYAASAPPWAIGTIDRRSSSPAYAIHAMR